MASARASGSDERGQVLIIVAGAFAALFLGGPRLDWGFGLTQRRVMQIAADAGAVAAGQLLIRVVFPGLLFAVTENEVFCKTLAYARSNETNLGTIQRDPKNRPGDLRLQWAINSKTTWNDLRACSAWLKSNPRRPPAPGIDCANGGTESLQRNGGPTFDPTARYLRIGTSTTFRAILAGRTVTAGASATAFIHGTRAPTAGPSWPITRHYTRAIFNESCRNPCSPQQANPVASWSSGGGKEVADEDYSTFHGMIDYSRYSMLIADARNCYVSHNAARGGTGEPLTPAERRPSSHGLRRLGSTSGKHHTLEGIH